MTIAQSAADAFFIGVLKNEQKPEHLIEPDVHNVEGRQVASDCG
jgi:hypothetical protein